MGRTLALRKCGEHEDCQLQSLNGGEWRHTPATTPLSHRLATNPVEIEELEKKLAGEVGQAMELRVQMGERLHLLEDKLRGLDERVQALPAVQRLHDEAERIQTELSGEQKHLLKKANRLQRDLDRLDRFTTKLEDVVLVSQQQSEQAARDASAAAETATHLNERLPRIDGTLSQQDELLGKLVRVESLYSALNDLAAKQAADVAALRSDLSALNHDLAHERDERIQGTEKTQRQFGEVMKHLG